jgi:hypothetical protein
MSSVQFRPCTCGSVSGFGTCKCLNELEKQNDWLFHQEKFCCNPDHNKFKQNGYFLLTDNNYCQLKKSETFEETLNRSNFPCSQPKNLFMLPCNCIADHRRKYSPWHAFYATHYHSQHQPCSHPNHVDYYKVQHFVVPSKPVWPHHCQQPLKGEFPEEIQKLSFIFGLECQCSTNKICLFCWRITRCNSLTFTKESCMSLHLLSEMFCAIQWDQIPIVTVPFKPLWNQDGSRNV